MEGTPSLLSLLQKNNVNHFANLLVFQKKTSFSGLDDLTIFTHSLWSTFTFNFPFSLSFESDIIRYSWFDWYSLRNNVTAKAIDTSVFNLHGSKDYSYTFTKFNKSEILNKTDNFFVKYLYARKLLLPTSLFTPLFFNKFTSMSNENFYAYSDLNFHNYKFLLSYSS